MGRFTTLQPRQIKPSQDFLKPATVSFILACLKSGEIEKLPPPPIVRADPSGGYVAIDGHNLIAVATFLKQSVPVYIAVSHNDGLDPADQLNSSGALDRNRDLAEKYDIVVRQSQTLSRHGIASFAELVEANRELFRTT